jgi:hypothetical protein
MRSVTGYRRSGHLRSVQLSIIAVSLADGSRILNAAISVVRSGH